MRDKESVSKQSFAKETSIIEGEPVLDERTTINIVEPEKIQELIDQSHKNIRSTITPCLTRTDLKRGVIKELTIDATFLEEGRKDEYLELLLVHEEAESRLRIDRFKETGLIRQDPHDELHKKGVEVEYREAKTKGLLEEYHGHWKKWLTDRIDKLSLSEAEKMMVTQDRLSVREKVFEKLSNS